jgi:NADH:ubiquinone oxidoreductase subunit 5 (subunit L)/multisubunit Na+/H+ antiporter MnhA subunit
MAFLAGFFLIGPMWLIVLHNTRYTALVSTTVLVVVFGILMAAFQTDYKDVISNTAAY